MPYLSRVWDRMDNNRLLALTPRPRLIEFGGVASLGYSIIFYDVVHITSLERSNDLATEYIHVFVATSDVGRRDSIHQRGSLIVQWLVRRTLNWDWCLVAIRKPEFESLFGYHFFSSVDFIASAS